MNNRNGIERETEGPLFVKRNPIYWDRQDMPSYVGAAPYGVEKTWNDDQLIRAHASRTNTPGPDAKRPNAPVPDTKKTNTPGLITGNVKDDDENIQGGCCGKNFDVFSDETSFHGLKHINGENNRSRRIAWIIILILAFTGLSWQINRSVSTYFDYPTNTILKYVTKSSIVFPKVTVCNINMFKFDEVTPLMGGYLRFYYDGLQYLRSLMPNIGITSNSSNGNGELLNGTYPGNTNLQEFIRYNAHQIKDMLEACIFNGVECGPENFTLAYTNYGACYIFTPINNKVSMKNAGQRYGLSMILNVEHLQYITAPRENVGFRIAIDCLHDSPNLEASGVDVGTGMRASISLRKQTIKTLPPPHGTCIVEGEKQLKYFPNVPYTQSRCLLECETDHFMDACGCRTYYTPGNKTQPFCSPADLTGCYIPKYEEFAEKRGEGCRCEEACLAEFFTKTNSFSGFPSRGVPQTFLVTKQYEYYALGLGFNIKQGVEHEKQQISEEVVNRIEQFAAETFDELQIPNYSVSLSTEHTDVLYSEFKIICYDLIFFTTNEISDNLYYDFKFEQNYTAVNSEFYNETFDNAKNELYSQTDTMLITVIETIRDALPSLNYTEKEAVVLMVALVENVYEYAYPMLREACSGVARDIYKTSDLAGLTYDYMRDNLARVDIYFESLNVEEVNEQKAYEFFSIICDLGGALGLFFGASIVAFVEAIDFWIIRGCCGCKKK